MAEPAPRVTLVRGDYTVAPGDEWTSAAAQAHVYVVSRETTGPVWRASDFGAYEKYAPLGTMHLACDRCGQSVICLSPDIRGAPYRVSAAEILAGILAHLRQCHADVVAS